MTITKQRGCEPNFPNMSLTSCEALHIVGRSGGQMGKLAVAQPDKLPLQSKLRRNTRQATLQSGEER